MDLIEKIGPILGVVAFFGLAFLAFLIFQQSREVRRLRQWAGRSPERAQEAADATAAAAEIRGEQAVEEPEPGPAGRAYDRVMMAVVPRFEAIDRRLPIDGRIVLAVLAVGLIAAVVLTSGFGLFGGDGGAGGGGKKAGGQQQREDKEEPAEVAVLNATQVAGIQGVPGLASRVASEVVKPTGFDVGAQDNASSGFAETVVMFEPGAEQQADELASKVSEQLGETPVQPMDEAIREKAEGAELALVIGQDDSQF